MAESRNQSGDKARAAPHAGWAVIGALGHLSASRGNLYVGLACDWLIGLVLFAAALEVGKTHVGLGVVTVAAGFLVFSFIEYAAHRWLFHARSGPIAAGHARHHQNADGYDALPFFIPPLVMCALAALAALLIPVGYALLLAGAVALGYALYGSSHTVLHAYRFKSPLLRRWQEFHDVHHEFPETNFGVTTPLWDILLGTCHHASDGNGTKAAAKTPRRAAH